jgi:hypothetical protein
MPASDFYSPEQVRKAAEALRQEQERTRNFEARARRGLFNNALERGLLDDYINENVERSGVDPEDVRYELTPSDFPDAIPYDTNIEVDPYYEEYSGYRLAAQNPKVREALIRDAGFPEGDQEGLLNRVYEDVRTGRINPEDMRVLSRPFESRLLDDEAPSAASWEAANFVEQAGTRGESPALDPAIWEGAIGLEEDLSRANQVAQLPTMLQRDRRAAQEMIDRARGEVSRSGSLFSDEAQRRLTELEQRIPPDDIPETRQEAFDRRNTLYELQRNLSTFNPRDPYIVDIRNPREALGTVLPVVREALGDEAATTAALENIRQQRLAQQTRQNSPDLVEQTARANREYDLRGPSAQSSLTRELERLNEASRNPRLINTETVFRPQDGPGETPYIPGLVEAIQKNQEADKLMRNKDIIDDLKSVVQKYPEVERLLKTEPFTKTPSRIRGEEFSPYTQFADIEQTMSMPADRAKVYDRILNSFKDPELKAIAEGKLEKAENLYTSGVTSLQKNARQIINELSGEDAFRGIEQPSFRTKRPIVGGGFYTDPLNPTLAPYTEYINKRAADINNALKKAEDQLGPKLLSEIYPGLKSQPYESTTAAFKYDPETKQVTPADIRDESAYRVKVNPADSGSFRVLPANRLGGSEISINALKFLADNPVIGEGSVSFDTAKPFEDYSGYSAQADLPPEIARQFERFVRDRAFQGARPGSLVVNSPVSSRDLAQSRLEIGETADTSSTLRKLEPFITQRQQLPNLRGSAYMSAGFGPVDLSGRQSGYIDPEGRIVPLQLDRPEPGLKGIVEPKIGGSVIRQDVLPLSSTPRYYSVDPVIAGARGAVNLGQAIRRTPSALLPGAADLIPSPEAIRTGYSQGLPAMGQQMASEFVQSLPASAAAAGVLSTPVAAPFAPGIGLGLTGVAGTQALNEVVKQQTGEGIVPKLRQTIGTAPRSGSADRPRQAKPQETARLTKTRSVNPLVREAQNRLGLARQRFNPARGEFGLTELLFGR